MLTANLGNTPWVKQIINTTVGSPEYSTQRSSLGQDTNITDFLHISKEPTLHPVLFKAFQYLFFLRHGKTGRNQKGYVEWDMRVVKTTTAT